MKLLRRLGRQGDDSIRPARQPAEGEFASPGHFFERFLLMQHHRNSHPPGRRNRIGMRVKSLGMKQVDPLFAQPAGQPPGSEK